MIGKFFCRIGLHSWRYGDNTKQVAVCMKTKELLTYRSCKRCVKTQVYGPLFPDRATSRHGFTGNVKFTIMPKVNYDLMMSPTPPTSTPDGVTESLAEIIQQRAKSRGTSGKFRSIDDE